MKCNNALVLFFFVTAFVLWGGCSSEKPQYDGDGAAGEDSFLSDSDMADVADIDLVPVIKPLSAYTRTFSTVFGSNFNESVTDGLLAQDGTVILTGYTDAQLGSYADNTMVSGTISTMDSLQLRDIFLVTIDKNGLNKATQFGWNSRGRMYDESEKLLEADENTVLIGGIASSKINCEGPSCQDATIIQFDRKNNVLRKTFTNATGIESETPPIMSRIKDMVLVNKNTVITAGWAEKTVYVNRINTELWNIEWTAQFTVTQESTADRLFLLNNGDVLIIGTTRSDMCKQQQKTGSNKDLFFLRLNEKGETINCTQLYTPEDEQYNTATSFKEGHIIIGSRRAYQPVSESFTFGLYYDSSSNTVTTVQLPEIKSLQLSSIINAGSSSLLAAGRVAECTIDSVHVSPCLILLQFDSLFKEVSRRYFGSMRQEKIDKIIIGPDQSILIIGDLLSVKSTGRSNRDIWLEKWEPLL